MGTTHDQEIQFGKSLSSLVLNAKAFARSLLRKNYRYQWLHEDLAQAALLKAWENRDRIIPGSNLKAWLFTVIRNSIVTYHRRHWRETLVESGDPDQRDNTANPERAFAVRQAFDHLDLLTAEHRQVLIDSAWHGFAYKEMAGRHGVPTGTIKSRISRARKALSRMVDPDELKAA